jgi:hypothetical protein
MGTIHLFIQLAILIGVIYVIILLRKRQNLQPSTIVGKIAKKFLKTNYYWEFKEFFNNLPEMLPIPEFVEKTNNRIMTEKEMTDGHEFLNKEEAFGLAAKMIQDKKEGLVWFKEEGGLCRVDVWHRADGPDVFVHKFRPGDKWGAGSSSFFRS